MTMVSDGPDLHRPIPGWDLSANLLPPQIMAGRRARTTRNLVGLSLLALALLCVAATVAVRLQGHSGANDLQSEQARTVLLQKQQHNYDGVTAVKGSIVAIQTQIADLMKTDATVGPVITDVIQAEPAGTKLSQVSVNLLADGASDTATTGGAGLDTASAKHIGTFTLDGFVPHYTDVAKYIDSLGKVAGVVQAYPGAITVGKTGTQFSITMVLTDVLRSHQFDLSTLTKGTK